MFFFSGSRGQDPSGLLSGAWVSYLEGSVLNTYRYREFGLVMGGVLVSHFVIPFLFLFLLLLEIHDYDWSIGPMEKRGRNGMLDVSNGNDEGFGMICIIIDGMVASLGPTRFTAWRRIRGGICSALCPKPLCFVFF